MLVEREERRKMQYLIITGDRKGKKSSEINLNLLRDRKG